MASSERSTGEKSATLIKRPEGEEDAATTMAVSAQERTQEQLLEIIVRTDDVSWKAIVFGLIESEQMDPWDIDISRLSQRFLAELKKLKEHDFRISGKVVLASAILLKLKAEKLHDEEVAALDHLISSVEEPVDLGLDALGMPLDDGPAERTQMPRLTPRTPQPRMRKVSIYDLVEALEDALETEARRPPVFIPRTLDTIAPPETHVDISEVIKDIYEKVHAHYEVRKEPDGSLHFHHLARSEDPRDRVLAFIPLLHLENARKVEMRQQVHFGPISVHLLDAIAPEKYAPGHDDVPKEAKEASGKKAPKAGAGESAKKAPARASPKKKAPPGQAALK